MNNRQEYVVDSNLKKIENLKGIYDNRYLLGYRERLVGYEIARWRALDHFIGKVLKVTHANRVLDYGCGSGLHVDLWKNVFPNAEICFCDISSVALEKLVGKYPEFKDSCDEVKGNKAAMRDSFFDVVVSVEVMEHVDNLGDYLFDIYRLLKPGGVFIWSVPCANKLSIEHIYYTLTRNIQKTYEGYRLWKKEDPMHFRRMTSVEMEEVLSRAGFCKVGFRFRSHFFSFICTNTLIGRLGRLSEKLMLLDYSLFRRIPNGASLLGYAIKK